LKLTNAPNQAAKWRIYTIRLFTIASCIRDYSRSKYVQNNRNNNQSNMLNLYLMVHKTPFFSPASTGKGNLQEYILRVPSPANANSSHSAVMKTLMI